MLGILSFLTGSVFFRVNIADRFPMEFIFSFFLMMGSIFFLSFGVLAEIGTCTYFARRNRRPYVLRHLARQAAGVPALVPVPQSAVA